MGEKETQHQQLHYPMHCFGCAILMTLFNLDSHASKLVNHLVVLMIAFLLGVKQIDQVSMKWFILHHANFNAVCMHLKALFGNGCGFICQWIVCQTNIQASQYVIQHLLCVNDNSTCWQTISSRMTKSFASSMNCRRMKNSFWCTLQLTFCPTSSNTFWGENLGQRSSIRDNNGNIRVCQNSALHAASQIFCQKARQ